jgi:putative MFS transporter
MERQAPMLAALDDAPITSRYKKLALLVMFGAVLDLFDFFLIAFIVPVVADEWDLTFGETAIVLLSAGVGSVFGAILFGRLGDRFGRKPPLVAGVFTFSLATGVLAASPDDGWWFMSIFRFVVGAGVAGVAVIALPMALEFTPTRLRTKLVGLVTTAMVPIGLLAAAGSAALFIPLVGWRPLFVAGTLPVVVAVITMVWARESPRWLLDQGRAEEARDVIAWLLERPPEELAVEAPAPAPAGVEVPPLPAEVGPAGDEGAAAGYRAAFRHPRSVLVTVLAWFGASVAVAGLLLWGPTFLEIVLAIEAEDAAALFALVTVGSFAGRLCFSFLPARTGRRFCGMLMGFGAAPLLAVAGLAGESEIAGISVFLLAVIAASFFVDGGFANLAPYTPEIFPTKLRTHGMGIAWATSGLGRIIGPAAIGLIAGSGDLVEPEATLDALAPAFLFLAGASLIVGVGFLLVDIEPHGRDLETLSADLLDEARRRDGHAPAPDAPAPVARAPGPAPGG